MPVIVAPDIKAAIIEKLLSVSEVTAVTTNIGSAHKQTWGPEPPYMLLIRYAGNPGEENWQEIGFRATRLDLEFHGPTPDLAAAFSRLVDAVLCPDKSSGLKKSFRMVGCRVTWIERESGPFELVDEVTRLSFIVVGYIAYWAGQPI